MGKPLSVEQKWSSATCKLNHEDQKRVENSLNNTLEILNLGCGSLLTDISKIELQKADTNQSNAGLVFSSPSDEESSKATKIALLAIERLIFQVC